MADAEPQGRVATIAFTGTRSELFGILFRGYLLTIPTIGLYRFWLTTWKRRFYWHHTVIDGEPLEYTGDAIQLLIGFLFALAFFLPLYVALFYLSTQSPDVVVIGYAVIATIFWFMIGYAIYRARDFRLSRTLWRGIRFNQHGSAWIYALKRFGWTLLMVPTLGLVYPWMASSLWRYRYRHTWYGDRQFRWSGSWKTIAGPYFLNYFVMLAVAIAATAVAGAAGTVVIGGVAIPRIEGILAFLGAGLVIFLGWFYFRSREATRMFSEVWIGEARLTVRVRGRALFGQFVLYALALFAALLLLIVLGFILMAILAGDQLLNPTGSLPVDLAQVAGASWLALAALIFGYLLILGTFALMSEVFLGYGYWMLVARGATIANADSLLTVRAADEDRALAGEGLADALNVGAY